MKKIWFLLLFLPLVQACTQSHPTNIETTKSASPLVSGDLMSKPLRNDDPNIPNCEPLDLKPIKPEEIIKIDDVVENCTYETGHIVYNKNLWSSETLFMKIKIWKNFITQQDPKTYDEDTICEYQEKFYNKIDVYDTPSGSKDTNKSVFLQFLSKYKIQKKRLVEYTSELNSIMQDNNQNHYGCKEKIICKKLIPKTYGGKWDHYFLFNYPNPENSTKTVILDDKQYSIGDFNYFSPSLLFIKQWPRTPWEFKKNKLIVRRYINGQLRNPKRSSYQEKETIWTFQLQTCEIPL